MFAFSVEPPLSLLSVTESHLVNKKRVTVVSLSPLVILVECLNRVYLYNDQTWRWMVLKISLSLLSRSFQGAGFDARDWQILRGRDNCSLASGETIIPAL